jgi:hypothetical protein
LQAYDRGELIEVFGHGTAAVISPVGELIFGDKHNHKNSLSAN